MEKKTDQGPETCQTHPGGGCGINLYMSQMVGGWSFGQAELVPGVNTDADNMQPFIRRDGREQVFASNRSGGQENFDIWSASKDSIAEPWSTPLNLGLNLNSAAGESRPSLTWDGTMLLFGTTRSGVEGASDIFFSTRKPQNR